MVKFSEEEIVENIFKKFGTKRSVYWHHWFADAKGITVNCLKTPGKKIFKSQVDGEVKTLLQRCRLTVIKSWYRSGDWQARCYRYMKVRISQSVQKSLQVGRTWCFYWSTTAIILYNTAGNWCVKILVSATKSLPQQFSFNSPYGACPTVRAWDPYTR